MSFQINDMDVVPQSTGCNHNDEEKQRQLADVPINDVKHMYMRTSSRVGTSISSAASSSAHDTSIIRHGVALYLPPY